MLAGGQGVPLVHQDGPLGVGGVELADHVDGLAVAHDAGLGVAEHQVAQGGSVVGLHVVDEDIVQLPAAEGMLQILHKLGLDRSVHRIEEDSLLVQEQVGVVGHPPGDGVGRLEDGVLAVVGADPDEVAGNFAGAVHRENLAFVQEFCRSIV